MIPDLDIFRSAQALIKHHGDDAPIHAAMRADAMLEKGDGTVPPEVWNRLGTKVLPKLRSGDDLSVGIEFTVSVGSAFAKNMETELRQILNDLGLGDRVRVERN